MMHKKIISEYQVRPLDEYGDCIEPHFYDSEQEARSDKADLAEMHPDADSWLFEQNLRVYASDGELLSEDYKELSW